MGSIWAKNGGIYVGYAAEWLEGPPPPVRADRLLAYSDDRHIVTFGPNGSGKSRRLLLPNLVRLTDWSMLVVDPKGDLAAMTAAYRQKQGSKIVILNPFGVHDCQSARKKDPLSASKKDPSANADWAPRMDVV